MYQNDFGPMNYGGVGVGWMPTLLAYQSNVKDTLFCPTAPTNNIPAANLTAANPPGATTFAWFTTSLASSSSYSLNGWLYLAGDPAKPSAARYSGLQTSIGAAGLFNKQDNIKHSSETPVFGDGVWTEAWPDASDSWLPYNLFSGTGTSGIVGQQMGRFTISRHGISNPAGAPQAATVGQLFPGGINLSMSDGHVEFAKLDSLWSQYYWNAVSSPGKRPGGP
jgi:hypothetical protein